MIEINGRYWLFTRMRPDIFVKIVVLTLFFGGMLVWEVLAPEPISSKQLRSLKDLGLGALLLYGMIGILIWSNKTYKISYDADAVYMGGSEWRWRKLRFVGIENVMRYDEIAELGAGQGDGIYPFAYIAFLREGGGYKDNGEWEEKFFMSRLQLKDIEIREFLDFLYTKIPEKFPDELLEFMQS
jgi:hypothetical protein